MSKRQTSSRKAFTLVEVILAVVVLGVLALVLGNSFSDATEESKWKVKQHNAAQITERGRLADELGYHWAAIFGWPFHSRSNFWTASNLLYSNDNRILHDIPVFFPNWAEAVHGIEIQGYPYSEPPFNPNAYEITSTDPWTVEPIPNRPDLEP